jgi:propionyl-CoA carboxylase beta chain
VTWEAELEELARRRDLAYRTWITFLVRRVYGVAGAANRPFDRFSPRYAWPSGSWGSLPLEGGIEAAYR